MSTPLNNTLDEEMVKISPEGLVLKIDTETPNDVIKITNSSFRLTNINKETKIGFKLNTNRGELYLLKPSVGVINQGETIFIGVQFKINKSQINHLLKGKHAFRIDTFKITKDMEPIGDIKQLIKKLKETARRRMDKIRITYDITGQKGVQLDQKTLKKTIVDIPNTNTKLECEKKTAQLDSLNTQLGDMNLKHAQLNKATQKETEVKQTSGNDPSKNQSNQRNIAIPIAVIVCILALIMGYVLTK